MHRAQVRSPLSEMWEEFLELPLIEQCDHGINFRVHCSDCERERELRG